MKLERAWALAPVGVVAALMLLLGTVTLGVRLRSVGDPDWLPVAAALDYGAGGFADFSPLSELFIRDVLGGVVDFPSDVAGTGASDHLRPGEATSATVPFKRVEVTHALTNDDRADALRVPNVPFTGRTDTRQATREEGETSACGPAGRSVWYRYTPPVSTGLIANTFGSNYATTMGVYSAAGGSAVACDTDVQGNAIVQFLADKGSTYLFQVSGPAGGGDLVFNLDPEGVTTLGSVSSGGTEGNLVSARPSLSADGRFVAFESDATNLVPDDDNYTTDIFVRDRIRSTTTRVSVSSSGDEGNGVSSLASISGNGRYVAFNSLASNLVAKDSNGITDVFVHDLKTRRTERASVSTTEKQAERLVPSAPNQCDVEVHLRCTEQLYPSLSHDGRFVAFQSSSANLVANDRNNTWDAFVRDRSKGTTERVSVSSTGKERGPDDPDAEGETWVTPSISGNGRFVSFRTSSGHITPGDDNHAFDIFVHDRVTRATDRVAGSTNAVVEFRTPRALSFDGRFITFATTSRPGMQGPTPTSAFAHDRRTGKTIRVNVSSSGKTEPQMTSARSVSISANGRYVTFHAVEARNVNYDSGDVADVFVRDLLTHTTVQLTRFPGGVAGRASCRPCGASIADVSADGRVVAYQSDLVTPLASATSFTQVYVNERPAPAG